jgi:hypothetical protein
MNERIKELFEQAHIQPPATRSGQFAFTPPKTFSPEKFAELIVRECKYVILDMMDNKQGDFNTLDLSLTEINEHFGVEDDE